jgi:hypothetical protein
MRRAVASDEKQLGPMYDPDRNRGLMQTTLESYVLPWLGGDDQRHRPFSDMLKALKVAMESHLETKLCDTGIFLPFHFTEPYYQMLGNATAAVSLGVPKIRTSPAAMFAGRVYGLDADCNYYDSFGQEKLILAIEYSRAAVTAFLIHDDCGVWQRLRVVHDTRLGLDNLRDGEAGWTDMERVLRNITQLPLKDGTGAGLGYISDIMLLRESARDTRIQNVLRTVLGERYGSLTKIDGYAGAVDPLFVGSRGAAYYSWFRQDDDAHLHRIVGSPIRSAEGEVPQ